MCGSILDINQVDHSFAISSGWNEPTHKAAFHQSLNAYLLLELACQDDQAALDSPTDLICLNHLIQNFNCYILGWLAGATCPKCRSQCKPEKPSWAFSNVSLEWLCFNCMNPLQRFTNCAEQCYASPAITSVSAKPNPVDIYTFAQNPCEFQAVLQVVKLQP